jgi:hypothetical protein
VHCRPHPQLLFHGFLQIPNGQGRAHGINLGRAGTAVNAASRLRIDHLTAGSFGFLSSLTSN